MEEKLFLLRDIADTDRWVIEGVQFKWADSAIERADMIFVIDTPPLMNYYLILKRFGRQCLRLEPAPYRPTFGTLMQAWGWNVDYRRDERQLLLAKLAPYRKKLFVVCHPKKALALVERSYGADIQRLD